MRVADVETGSAEARPAEPDPSPARDPSSRKKEKLFLGTRVDWAVGLGVLAVYAIVQTWLLLGPHPSDPAHYFEIGVDYPDVPANRWTMRIGLTAPVRAAVLVFGPSEAALYAVPFAFGLLLAASAYVATLALFRERVAAAAAALVTVLNPYFLLNSSSIFPDTSATATFTAGFACLVLAASAARRGGERWVPTVLAASAGVFFGWSYLIREFSPILLPAVVVIIVLLRYPLRRAGVVAAAALAIYAIEPLYGWVKYGNPLMHVEVLQRRQDRGMIRSGRQQWMADLHHQLHRPLDTIAVLPRLLLTWNVGWIYLGLLALFVLALVLIRDRRLWLLAAWLFSFWAAMVVLGRWWLPSGDLVVNVTNLRYWYPFFPPLAIGAFGGLTLLARAYGSVRVAKPLAIGVAAVLALGTLVPGSVAFSRCEGKDVWRNDPMMRWHELRSWLAGPEADRYDIIWTDPRSSWLIPAFARTTFGKSLWHGEARALRLSRKGIPASQPGSVVLIHKDRTPQPAVPRDELRRGWAPIFMTSDTRMVVFAKDPVAGPVLETPSVWTWQVPGKATKADVSSCGINPYEP
jgi:4-amino-4-deoxy-L-arabinose transferase-like glycosyltransferase